MTQRVTARNLVRPLEPRDAHAVQEILERCPEAAAWSSESYRDLDRRGFLGWVVEVTGSVCGLLVARTAADQGEVLNLAVDPASRRAGNASALLDRAIAEFETAKISDVFLEVRESNSAAIAFYEHHGFIRNRRRPAYYQNPAEAAVLMVKKLTG